MRRRLTLLVAATTSLVLVAFLVPLALLVRTVAADRALSGATLEVESLASLVTTVDRQPLTLALEQAAASGGRPVTVFFPDGSTVGAPARRSAAVDLAARGNSVTAKVPGGREILVAVEGMPAGTAVVRTYVSDGELSRGVTRAWLILAILGVALLGLGLLVADRLARSLVGSARELASVSHELAAGRLGTRAQPGATPELRDVATALNHLAGRIQELIAQEREAAADLSHRLRTQLTALRLELESLRDPDEAARAEASVAALERAVSQIIADTRRPSRTATGGRCDAAEVVGERVRFWAVLAEDQNRTLTFPDANGPLPVAVSRDDLAACVDALFGNVFAHTPEGTPFAVGLTARPEGGARLTVSDEGPGFTTPDLQERGVSGAGSSGLGLDIVRRTAESSGGTLTLGRSTPGGALVTLDLAAP
ncbi:HAMP domain-containing sensor histidine kinase [Actinoallomurus iriomotensis]|uniref:Signal transduction histidine-protein kinase/phosphatase MprB n=1 Tax=Actinoallomurus iriomotensis TaxID=478107 RepID=A0A9W6SDU4_9ACTN|nr:HAMP domain-containing sensor histidine kinase [Actinoallomurus iriomotensis]GLY91771.1 two-component sensor histidine kinase [Actinoallomurus iriomotensis]